MLAVGRDAARITPDLDLRRLLLERIDVVHDRDLPQDHLADDMARLDVRSENRRSTGDTGRKTRGKLRVVELDANDKWRRRDLPRRHGCAGSEDLACRRRLQDGVKLRVIKPERDPASFLRIDHFSPGVVGIE
jgi:hypothetical protein